MSLFTSLGGISPGYTMAKVTPYMHAMVYHVPRFLAELQSIKKFTGQGKTGLCTEIIQIKCVSDILSHFPKNF